MIKKIIFAVSVETLTIVIVFILSQNIFYSAFIGALIAFVFLITYQLLEFKSIAGILDQECNPQKYIERFNKIYKTALKKERINTIYKLNYSAAYICMGCHSAAKEILLSIKDEKSINIPVYKFVYLINLISCYYVLGEIEKAEEIYENELIRIKYLNKKMLQSIDMLRAERMYYLKRYEESRGNFNSLLKLKISKRMELSILYFLAKMDEIEGKTEDSKVKYKKIADEGNTLWIAIDSREKL